MDGLRLTTSGIAAASLSIQLVESVQKIRRFLHHVSEAPKELQRLLDLLEQLELIFQNIRMIIGQQPHYHYHHQYHRSDLDGDVAASVWKATKMCERDLSRLEKVIEAAKVSPKSKNRATKSFESFRLACKKRDIEEFEMHLQQAIGVLNLTMTMNLMAIHTQSTKIVTDEVGATQIEHRILQSHWVKADSPNRSLNTHKRLTCHDALSKDVRSRKSRPRPMSISCYSTALGVIFIRKKLLSEGDTLDRPPTSGSRTFKEIVLIFMPWFYSQCIRAHYSRAFGSIQASFRTYPLIANSHPIWKMLSLNDEQTDNYGRRSSYYLEWSSEGAKPSEIRDAYILFASRPESIDLASSSPMIFSLHSASLETFNFLSDSYVTGENINFFSQPPILCAFRSMIFCSSSDSIAGWRTAIRRLIALGADLHESFGVKYTFLDAVMDLADSPFESADLDSEWLGLLEEAGIDVAEYLRTERVIHFDGLGALPKIRMSGRHLRERALIISEEGERMGVSTDWAMDPRSQAFEALHEFRHFGPMHHSKRSDCWEPDVLYNWPYFYPRWHSYVDSVDLGPMEIERRKMADVTVQRYDRRWKRKIVGYMKPRGMNKVPKVPGAWID
ncbi:hypothetical protein F5882DRAFT_387549 [Hyaloscypha sp. PMI_1271]|nr:hypothetical protein F5882DRAFT_387549 [Hyaloscypha sp. PMI_1271]